jgi:hypothetical protein
MFGIQNGQERSQEMVVKETVDDGLGARVTVKDLLEGTFTFGCCAVGAVMGAAVGSAAYGPIGLVVGGIVGLAVGTEFAERITGDREVDGYAGKVSQP